MEQVLLLESMNGVLWGSWPKAELVNSNQTSGVWVASRVSYLRGAQEEGPGRQEDCSSQGLLGKSYQELTFVCDSVCCYLEHALAFLREVVSP